MKRPIFTNRLLLAALVLAAPALAQAGGPRCESLPITAQLVESAEGRGLLCRGKRGIFGHLVARGLVPGDAYTVWWVYFDDPSQCEKPGECGTLADFGGDNPVSVFGRMDSSVVPGNGRMRFSGRVGGFTPSAGSQLWMWIFGHGEADLDDGRRLARQLLTPEDPSVGAPHLGNNADGPLGFPAAVVMFDIP